MYNPSIRRVRVLVPGSESFVGSNFSVFSYFITKACSSSCTCFIFFHAVRARPFFFTSLS